MTTAKFMYKCRLCGEVYSNMDVAIESGLRHLVNAVLDLKDRSVNSPCMTTIHVDCKNGIGVADLLGYEEVEDD